MFIQFKQLWKLSNCIKKHQVINMMLWRYFYLFSFSIYGILNRIVKWEVLILTPANFRILNVPSRIPIEIRLALFTIGTHGVVFTPVTNSATDPTSRFINSGIEMTTSCMIIAIAPWNITPKIKRICRLWPNLFYVCKRSFVSQ